MICAIQQPTFFPWIGYFEMISKVDRFVFLDNVQLVKRGWWVRNKIKNDQGELFLTVPIKKTKHRNELFGNNALIDIDNNFIKTHLKSIYFSYKKAIYFDEVYPFIESCYQTNNKYIAEFNIEIITKICNKLRIKTKTTKASLLKQVSGRKDKLIVSICSEIGASEYLSAQGSRDYIDKNNPGGAFVGSRVKLYYRQYKHPHYAQLFGSFISHLSVIDLLFNVGFKNSLQVITEGSRPSIYYRDLS